MSSLQSSVIYESEVKSKGAVQKTRYMVLTEQKIVISGINTSLDNLSPVKSDKNITSVKSNSLSRSLSKSLQRLSSMGGRNGSQSSLKSNDSSTLKTQKKYQVEIPLSSIIIVSIDKDKGHLTLKFKEGDEEISELTFITNLCEEWERRIRMLLVLENPFLYDRDFPM